jgi:hypothetical protein
VASGTSWTHAAVSSGEGGGLLKLIREDTQKACSSAGDQTASLIVTLGRPVCVVASKFT